MIIFQVATGEAPVVGFGPQQALVQLAMLGGNAAGTFNLVFMAFGSLPFLYLFWIASYAPRPLVGFGMLAYVLALVSGFTSILAPGSAVAGWRWSWPRRSCCSSWCSACGWQSEALACRWRNIPKAARQCQPDWQSAPPSRTRRCDPT